MGSLISSRVRPSWPSANKRTMDGISSRRAGLKIRSFMTPPVYPVDLGSIPYQYLGSYSSSLDLSITPFYRDMRPLSVLMTIALLTSGLTAQTPSSLDVVVLEGDGASNSLAGKTLHPVTI